MIKVLIIMAIAALSIYCFRFFFSLIFGFVLGFLAIKAVKSTEQKKLESV